VRRSRAVGPDPADLADADPPVRAVVIDADPQDFLE
jgi:hypothetical protein